MNRLTKHINRMLLATLVLMAVSIAGAVYLYAFDQNPPSAIFNSPMPTDKTEYHIGDTIFFLIDYCRYTDVAVTLHTSFSNNLIFNVPSKTFAGAPRGCGTVTGGNIVIPDNLPPGHYKLVGKNEYRVNFLATRYVDWYTTEFEIVK